MVRLRYKQPHKGWEIERDKSRKVAVKLMLGLQDITKTARLQDIIVK